MTTTAPPKRPTVRSRRAGYVIAVLVNAAMLFAVNRWPGWESLPFLTDDTRLVMSIVNASIVVNLVANVVYLLRDPGWLKSGGDVVTLGVGLAALVRIWSVFPFDLGDEPLDWTLVVRILLAIGIVGSIIGLVAAVVSFIRSITTS